jgi:hypothetical protein
MRWRPSEIINALGAVAPYSISSNGEDIPKAIMHGN